MLEVMQHALLQDTEAHPELVRVDFKRVDHWKYFALCYTCAMPVAHSDGRLLAKEQASMDKIMGIANHYWPSPLLLDKSVQGNRSAEQGAAKRLMTCASGFQMHTSELKPSETECQATSMPES
ncbi:unnamed protein product [Polarella glacialis]|uniref:Uncharacterized protein n=1 Tax=Polarella glacialis TaxID=89957 RepID=A0A813HYC2_POLGL|nr:unnamed protein product [Polarella glacialis]CAE8644084.1 unnamed protein product [Polarella glacialis]